MNHAFSLSEILAPVEFSERCRGAVRYAEALALACQAHLTLLHVVTPPYVAYGEVGNYPAASELLEQRWEHGRTELETFASDAPPELALQKILLEGDPARRIVEYAHSHSVGLIVMPTHAYGPFRRFLLGSVTAKVLHDCDCPVWTGPHLERAPGREDFSVRRILCAVDLGPQSCAALACAAGMAQRFSAALTIVHALPTFAVGAGGYRFDPEWRLEMEREARERIVHVQAELRAEADIRIVVGDAPAALRDAAQEIGADLLVIGRSHHDGVLGRLRATAYAIVREAPCPVASV